MKNLAQAEALEVGQQFEQYKLELGQLSQNIAHHVALTLEQMRRGGAQMPPGGNGQGDMGDGRGGGEMPRKGGTGGQEVPRDYQMNPDEMQQEPQSQIPEAIPGREGSND